MTFKTYEINVDLVNDASTTNTIRFSQNDRNSAKLLLTITNKGAELDLSQAKSVRMSFKKPDGTRVFQNDCQPINVLKGKYQILLKTQTLASIGNVIAQIHIEEEDRTIDTQKFLFVVNESLSSDGAVESTNEFTIIQKAIEAGKKLEGKDIDGIIAAGAKADAALPKAGGTMTGNIEMNGSRDLSFKNANSETVLRNNTSGNFALYDKKNDNVVWAYNPSTKAFTVDTANTNLVKSNQIYTGWLHSIGTTKQLGTGDDLNNIVDSGLYGGTGLLNSPDGLTAYHFYVEVIKYNDTNYTLQRATTLAGNITISGNVGTWVRRKSGSGWGAWEKLLDSKGGTMTGALNMDRVNNTRSSYINYSTGAIANFYVGQSIAGKYHIYDDVNKVTPFEYDPTTQSVNVNTNTNLVKKAGDSMTGDLQIMAANKGFQVGNGIEKLNQSVDSNGVYYWYSSSTKSPLRYDIKTDTLSLLATNLKTAKDDRATIPVTADAELVTSYGVIADRRGNTVTLRAPIKRKVGSTNGHVFTLPPGMRPTMMLTQVVHASDGTPALVTIPSDTGQVLLQTITPAIMGKDYHIVLTYVVD
ncbi:BppU family phage baseplate upper protein [Bacillus mycoides]|uniref:BppU family phage baseplate upper protein n=2 Tax=Bacteria TaxID=2 RepID=UPI001F2F9010|nr:BppU family phage baseplate upper protein [Bacillus mycoides]